MMDPQPNTGLGAILNHLPEHLTALLLSGAGGAYVRAVFAPETSWRRRVVEGSAGAVSAIFLGGLVGHMIDSVTGATVYAYLTGGFLMGEGGIAAVRGVRRYIFKEMPK